MMYLLVAGGVFATTLVFTAIVRAAARYFKVVDIPEVAGRKIHKRPVPLLGGVALYGVISLAILFLLKWWPGVLTVNISSVELLFVLLGGLIIIAGGVIDDKYDLPPKKQMIFPIAAVLITFLGGIELLEITNPFGGVLKLDSYSWGPIIVLGDALVFVWLLGMTYTTKLLDGLDGLATGVVGIGALMIAFLSLFTKYYQPDVALLAIILAAACGAFLLFNWHPASIFLGEGGSLFLGFFLGVLAVIAGGKIATTLLVMGLPVLDVLWVVGRRFFSGKKITVADAGHLHHRLLRAGFSHRGTVGFMYAVSLLFGGAAFILQGPYKLAALAFLVLFMLMLGYALMEGEKI